MDSQFSPFTIPQSPALGSMLMPPPSIPPPSLPPPLTNERPNETPPHHSSGSSGLNSSDKNSLGETKQGILNNSNNPQSLQPSLSFPGSMLNLASFNPFSAQAPSTPLASVTNDSHLHPTLQWVFIYICVWSNTKNFSNYFKEILWAL